MIDMSAHPRALARESNGNQAWSEVWRGLCQRPKRLPCKLLYDARSDELFERMTRQPEYYPARVELELLAAHAEVVSDRLGTGAVIVEFGSRTSRPVSLLLGALASPLVYVPIDTSRPALLAAAAAMTATYPGLKVRPLEADYLSPFALPLPPKEQQAPILAFLPGSAIGNWERTEALAFLRRVREALGPAHRFLIGVDVPKERGVLEAAYDDAAGFSAEFNRNLLRVVNLRFDGRFDVEAFDHRALWNEKVGRVELHLRSRRHQHVSIAGLSFYLRKGEPIVTEHCYKYHPQQFRRLAEAAGYRSARLWLDAGARFSLHLLEAA